MKTPNTDALLPPECQGERCSMCGAQAWHKVGEEMFSSDPMPYRHNLTAYVCKEHFQQIMDRGGFTRTPQPSVTSEDFMDIAVHVMDAIRCLPTNTTIEEQTELLGKYMHQAILTAFHVSRKE